MIRLAKLLDLAAMVEVYNQAIDDQVYANCDILQDGTESFKAVYFNGSNRYIVLVDEVEDGFIRGWGALKKFSARPNDAEIAEIAVYIARANRSIGLGIRLLQQMIKHAEDANFKSLMAVIVGKNHQSIRGSSLCGFEEYVRIRGVATLYSGKEDVVWMQKLLTTRDI